MSGDTFKQDAMQQLRSHYDSSCRIAKTTCEYAKTGYQIADKAVRSMAVYSRTAADTMVRYRNIYLADVATTDVMNYVLRQTKMLRDNYPFEHGPVITRQNISFVVNELRKHYIVEKFHFDPSRRQNISRISHLDLGLGSNTVPLYSVNRSYPKVDILTPLIWHLTKETRTSRPVTEDTMKMRKWNQRVDEGKLLGNINKLASQNKTPVIKSKQRSETQESKQAEKRKNQQSYLRDQRVDERKLLASHTTRKTTAKQSTQRSETQESKQAEAMKKPKSYLREKLHHKERVDITSSPLSNQRVHQDISEEHARARRELGLDRDEDRVSEKKRSSPCKQTGRQGNVDPGDNHSTTEDNRESQEEQQSDNEPEPEPEKNSIFTPFEKLFRRNKAEEVRPGTSKAISKKSADDMRPGSSKAMSKKSADDMLAKERNSPRYAHRKGGGSNNERQEMSPDDSDREVSRRPRRQDNGNGDDNSDNNGLTMYVPSNVQKIILIKDGRRITLEI